MVQRTFKVELLRSQFASENQIHITEDLHQRYRGEAHRLDVHESGDKYILEWSIVRNSSEADELNRAAIRSARNKQYEQAIENLQKAIDQEPSDPDFYYNLGLIYLEVKDIKSGIANLQKSIAICPVYAKAYFLLGSIYSKLREFDKSCQMLEEGLKLQHDNLSALVNLGAVFSIRKEFTKATVCFEKAISISPKESKAYLGLGKIYLASGDFENANRCFKAVIKIDPNGKLGIIAKRSIQMSVFGLESGEQLLATDSPESLYAEGYQNYLKGNYQRAAQAYRKYLSLKNSDIDVWAALASSQLRNGETLEAIQSIKQALVIQPSRASLYKQAAIIYDACEMHQEAINASQKAVDLGKRDSITSALLGKNHLKSGNVQEGFRFLQEALKINPNNLQARYYLAQALKSMGQIESARQHLEEILWSKIESPLKEKAKIEMQKLS